MDFGVKRRTRKARHLGDTLGQLYKHRLQFYKVPPTDTVSLFEFEQYAVERLKVLKYVEDAGVKAVKGSQKYNEHLEDELRKTPFKKLMQVNSTLAESEKDVDEDENNAVRLDHISHFILRLAYCRSEELRRWFLQQELDLFRFRFQLAKESEKNRFLEINNLHYESVSAKAKDKLLVKLADARNTSAATVETMQYFKVPFTEALDLVGRRRVYLERGQAYVPYDDMVSILLGVYRSHLSQALAVTARALPHLEEDERLLPMLCGLSKRYLGADYNVKKSNVGQITADMIEMLSKKSFPLCMQHLHTSLRQSHHLKHGGRMQYGLFLKGIGLSLDEAMKFWRAEFTKLIDVDKFDKQYSYNIRHNYGKEGKRADYTPYSCMKIIMSNAPGPGDNHGCPFKHTDSDLLKQKIKGSGIGSEYYDKVVEYLTKGHYQLACTRYFEGVHKVALETHNGFNHPNQYFEESQKEVNGLNRNKDQLGTPKTPRSSQVSSQSTPKSKLNVSQSGGSSQPLSGIEEMDDDFDLDAAEQSMQS